MDHIQLSKQDAIRYWERHRLLYNSLQILPAVLGYEFVDTMNWVGDPHRTNYPLVLALLVICTICANVFYAVSYSAIEFHLLGHDPQAQRLKSERRGAFVLVVLFSMLLSVAGGGTIANLVWDSRR